MPAPKDPEKYRQWIEKLKQAQARRPPRPKGRKQPAEEIARRAAAVKKAYEDKPELREKLSKIAKEGGYGKWMKGKKLPHITESNKRRRGKTYEELYGERAEEEKEKRQEGNQLHWKDKPRKRPRPQHDDGPTRRWRKAVFKRDNWTCQGCEIRGGSLRAHHKKPWSTHPELRYEIDNGITLCKDCHVPADREAAEYMGRKSLSAAQVREIRIEVARGDRYQDIADRYGVTRHVISGIVRGQTYKDVK